MVCVWFRKCRYCPIVLWENHGQDDEQPYQHPGLYPSWFFLKHPDENNATRSVSIPRVCDGGMPGGIAAPNRVGCNPGRCIMGWKRGNPGSAQNTWYESKMAVMCCDKLGQEASSWREPALWEGLQGGEDALAPRHEKNTLPHIKRWLCGEKFSCELMDGDFCDVISIDRALRNECDLLLFLFIY